MALQKREKTLLKALGIIVVVSGIILFFVYRTPQNQEPTPSTTQTATQQQTPDQPEAQQPSRPRATAPSGGSGGRVSSQPTQAIISIDEFQRHNSYDDCWVLIRGTVYDITDYLSELPNGKEASPYCGTYAFEEGFLGSSDVLVNEIIEQSSKIGTMG